MGFFTIRSALLVVCFIAGASAVDVDVIVSIDDPSSASALQVRLLPDFVKLVILTNGNGDITAKSESTPSVTVTFASQADADAFVSRVQNLQTLAVNMLALTCDQALLLGSVRFIKTCVATLPVTNITVTGVIMFKVGRAPGMPCKRIKASLASQKRGISIQTCGTSFFAHVGATKINLVLKLSVPNPDVQYITGALQANLQLIVPKQLEAPCGSTAHFSFVIEGQKNRVTASQSLFCGDVM